MIYRRSSRVSSQLYSLRQLEGVKQFCRGSKVAELVGRSSRSRKREAGKRSSEQGFQIIDRANADGDVWTVALSPVRGEVVCNCIQGNLVNFGVRLCGLEGGRSAGTAWCKKIAYRIE